MTAIAIPARQRHVLAFGKPLRLTDEQTDATVVGDSGDPAWSDRDPLPIQLCDELYEIRWLLQICGRLSDKQLQDSIDIGITQTLKKPLPLTLPTASRTSSGRGLPERGPPDQLLELIVTAGWYRLISYVINTCGVQREPWAARFPASACLQTSGNPELARLPTRSGRWWSRRARRRSPRSSNTTCRESGSRSSSPAASCARAPLDRGGRRFAEP
jgi:hypothetical protein